MTQCELGVMEDASKQHLVNAGAAECGVETVGEGTLVRSARRRPGELEHLTQDCEHCGQIGGTQGAEPFA